MRTLAVRSVAVCTVIFVTLGWSGAALGTAGDPVVMGATNDAGATNTALVTNSSGSALAVTQNGKGNAGRFDGNVQINGVCRGGCVAKPGWVQRAIDTTPDVGTQSSTTIGSDGLPLTAYFDAPHGDLRVAHCDDPACSSATITALDKPGNTGRFPSVAIGRDGLGIISYQGGVAGVPTLRVAHCSNLACTTATKTTLDGKASTGFDSSITVGSDGLGVIAEVDESGTPGVKLVHCSSVVCTTATVTQVDSPTGPLAFQHASITMLADSTVLLSYIDRDSQSLKFVHCLDVTCSALNRGAPPLPSGHGWGATNSLAVGTDGLGVAVGLDATTGSLQLVHCNTTNCGTATITPLFVFATDASITIGADGLPIIAVYGNNAQLFAVHCGDANCSGGNLISAIDGDDRAPAITIGVDGFPFITYWDANNQVLRITHCSVVFCTPYLRRR